MDEFLFFQELEKADEVTIIRHAPPVNERHVSLQVMRKPQCGGAARTVEHSGESWLRGRRMFTDELHQFQRGAWREFEAFIPIEPESLAGGAHVDVDWPSQAGFESHGSHFGGAAGAFHLPTL